MSGRHLTKEFAELIKAIGESKTKQEEDRIIKKEIVKLKTMFKAKSNKLSKKDKKEFLIRLIYAEMLGHDASFGYIRAVELTADSDVENKRVGYLCSSLCFSPEHEFRFMLVNVMSGDLASPNRLVVCTALTYVFFVPNSHTTQAIAHTYVNLKPQGAHENCDEGYDSSTSSQGQRVDET